MGKVVQLIKYALKRDEELEKEKRICEELTRDYYAGVKAREKRKELAHAEINRVLLQCGLNSIQISAVSDALIDGKIPHVTINYNQVWYD